MAHAKRISNGPTIVAATYRLPEALRDDLALLSTLTSESVNAVVVTALTKAVEDGLRSPGVKNRLLEVLDRMEREDERA